MMFWRRRLWRIVPSYWIALGASIAIASTVNGRREMFFTGLLTHIYVPEFVLSGLSQSWTLAVEIAFYFVLPLYGRALGRLVKTQARNRKALSLIAGLSAFGVLAYVFRLLVALSPRASNLPTNLWLPAHLDHFVLGMSIAVFGVWGSRNVAVRDLCLRVARRRTSWRLWAFLLFVFVATQWDMPLGLERTDVLRQSLLHACYGVIGALLVAPSAFSAFAQRTSKVALERFMLPKIGSISYGIYLWHMIILTSDVKFAAIPWNDFDGKLLTRLLVVIPASIVVAGINHLVVERPIAARMSRS